MDSPDDDEVPEGAASSVRRPSRMRFSLAAIMFVMTGASLVLGVARVIPIPEDLRRVLLVFSLVWFVVGLFAAGPATLRFFELRRQVQARNEKLQAWVKAKQRAAKNDGEGNP